MPAPHVRLKFPVAVRAGVDRDIERTGQLDHVPPMPAITAEPARHGVRLNVQAQLDARAFQRRDVPYSRVDLRKMAHGFGFLCVDGFHGASPKPRRGNAFPRTPFAYAGAWGEICSIGIPACAV